jgi:hypothetical protein
MHGPANSPPLTNARPAAPRDGCVRLSGLADEAGAGLATQVRAHAELGWTAIELRMAALGTCFLRAMSWRCEGANEERWRDEAIRRCQGLAKRAGDAGFALLHENWSVTPRLNPWLRNYRSGRPLQTSGDWGDRYHTAAARPLSFEPANLHACQTLL